MSTYDVRLHDVIPCCLSFAERHAKMNGIWMKAKLLVEQECVAIGGSAALNTVVDADIIGNVL